MKEALKVLATPILIPLIATLFVVVSLIYLKYHSIADYSKITKEEMLLLVQNLVE